MRAMADYRCYRCGKLDGVELRGIPCYDCRDGRSATFWRDAELNSTEEWWEDELSDDDEDDDDDCDDEDDEDCEDDE